LEKIAFKVVPNPLINGIIILLPLQIEHKDAGKKDVYQ
jgi:hypothetical protein